MMLFNLKINITEHPRKVFIDLKDIYNIKIHQNDNNQFNVLYLKSSSYIKMQKLRGLERQDRGRVPATHKTDPHSVPSTPDGPTNIIK